MALFFRLAMFGPAPTLPLKGQHYHMIHVVPVMMPQIDWPTYHSVVGSDPLRHLDRSGVDPRSPKAGYVVDERFANHLTLGFLVDSDEPLCEMLAEQSVSLKVLPIKFDRRRTTYLMSGTLGEWKEAVLCGTEGEEPLRIVMGLIYSHMAKVGLQDLWENYERVTLPDKTFKFRRK